MSGSAVEFIAHFSALAGAYDVILSDVWGVIHNGITAHRDACDALMKFRARGGRVVLITNAPRPRDSVVHQITDFGVPPQAYDSVVSSGDVTRAVIQSRSGESLFHIGPERDRAIFTGLGVRFASLECADYVVCSGLFDDELEKPGDYQSRLDTMLKRRMFMVCANPDVVVERGDRLVYCAGAIADVYAEMGGEVLYAGKPHRPIYEQAHGLAGAEPSNRVLAIGDSVRTDVKGAHDFGIDCLFLTAGIHAEELGGRDNPDARTLRDIFASAGKAPKAVMRKLVW
ncbi:MAG: TIGR01459 family HAD-type hydrolase [Pseudolabrys sp.]|nr:TIGR01459 family HAD-type hydrolase [Pseudolabrys sp.]